MALVILAQAGGVRELGDGRCSVETSNTGWVETDCAQAREAVRDAILIGEMRALRESVDREAAAAETDRQERDNRRTLRDFGIEPLE